MKPRAIKLLGCVSVVLVSSCGNDDADLPPASTVPPEPCKVVEQTGCLAGEVCEEVQGGNPACFKPVTMTGRVIDSESGGAIKGARVVARDANESAITNVALSAEDGTYVLTVPVQRDSNGKPLSMSVTLRADATGYLSFPKAPRQALPIDVASGSGDPPVVQSTATDIVLIQKTGQPAGWISGKVIAPNPAGTLVVASSGTDIASTGVADASGSYAVFNVPPGAITVSAYAANLQIPAVQTSVTIAQETKNVDLTALDPEGGAATATVSGNVQIVDSSGGKATSVVLAVEETFEKITARGEVPKGLRAANVTGAFSISGVPDGKYVVLAAFENDGLVRDPDTNIGGTQIVHLEVKGANQEISEGFKITGALEVVAPGANQIDEVSGTPTFQWKDDSSEDAYDVTLFDALGNQVWKREIPGENGKEVSASCDAQLKAGMFYQFRATSKKKGVALSTTEDLKGVFLYK